MVEVPEMKERHELVLKGENPYEDHRGKIDNFALPESINLLATITSKKGSMRANHYHPIQEQKCLIISGKYLSVYKDLLVKDGKIRTKIINAGDLSIMPPWVAHTMIFLEDTIFLNLVNGNRDHDKFGEHTIPFKLVDETEMDKFVSEASNL